MKHSLRAFDPKQVAALETSMWRAYYAHNFPKLFWLLYCIMRTQFGLGPFAAIRAGYYSGKATKDFRLSKGKYGPAEQSMTKLFGYIRRRSVESFDPQRVAKLEVKWWAVHRKPNAYKISLQAALAEAMAELYQVPARKLSAYADARAAAMHERRDATFSRKQEPDWALIQKELTRSYSELKRSIAENTRDRLA